MTYVQIGTAPRDIVMCPLCEGRGYDDTEQNQSGRTLDSRTPAGVPIVPLCRLCKGAQRLDRDRICACGAPAVFAERSADNTVDIVYCGGQACKGVQTFRARRSAGFAMMGA